MEREVAACVREMVLYVAAKHAVRDNREMLVDLEDYQRALWANRHTPPPPAPLPALRAPSPPPAREPRSVDELWSAMSDPAAPRRRSRSWLAAWGVPAFGSGDAEADVLQQVRVTSPLPAHEVPLPGSVGAALEGYAPEDAASPAAASPRKQSRAKARRSCVYRVPARSVRVRADPSAPQFEFPHPSFENKSFFQRPASASVGGRRQKPPKKSPEQRESEFFIRRLAEIAWSQANTVRWELLSAREREAERVARDRDRATPPASPIAAPPPKSAAAGPREAAARLRARAREQAREVLQRERRATAHEEALAKVAAAAAASAAASAAGSGSGSGSGAKRRGRRRGRRGTVG